MALNYFLRALRNPPPPPPYSVSVDILFGRVFFLCLDFEALVLLQYLFFILYTTSKTINFLENSESVFRLTLIFIHTDTAKILISWNNFTLIVQPTKCILIFYECVSALLVCCCRWHHRWSVMNFSTLLQFPFLFFLFWRTYHPFYNFLRKLMHPVSSSTEKLGDVHITSSSLRSCKCFLKKKWSRYNMSF